MKLYTHKRNSKDQPGFQDQSTKRHARQALKQAEYPAPKRDKKVIEWAGNEYTAQSKGSSVFGSGGKTKKSGKGKALRRATKKLAQLKTNGARPRSITRLTRKID